MAWLGLDALGPLSDPEEDPAGGAPEAADENAGDAVNGCCVSDAPAALDPRKHSPAKGAACSAGGGGGGGAAAREKKKARKHRRDKRRRRRKRQVEMASANGGAGGETETDAASEARVVVPTEKTADAADAADAAADASSAVTNIEDSGPTATAAVVTSSDAAGVSPPSPAHAKIPSPTSSLRRRAGSRPRRSTKFRQSNALNEDKYDFCLIIDTQKGRSDRVITEGQVSDDEIKSEVRLNQPRCFSGKCACCKKKTIVSSSEEDSEEDEENEKDGILNTSCTSTAPDLVAIHIEDEGPTSTTTSDLSALRRLQASKRRSRRRAFVAEEDDDREHHRSSESNTGDQISTSHTGVGLSGKRMVGLITHKLREAGLKVKRLRNLSGTRTLLKVPPHKSASKRRLSVCVSLCARKTGV